MVNNKDITIRLVKVNRRHGKPISLTYYLLDPKAMPPAKTGRIKIDKTAIFTGMFKKWSKISFNETDHRFEFPDPTGNPGNFYLYKEIVDLVDSFIIENYLIGK